MSDMLNAHLYGNFRNVKFTDIFNDVNKFKLMYSACGIDLSEFGAASDSIVTTLFYLLYARYGNSTIASSDENQFLYKLFSIVYSYGPTWKKRLSVQKALRDLELTDLQASGIAISNHANNPSTAPATDSSDILSYIDDQNTNQVKRGKLDAYMQLWAALDTDVTEEFLGQFKRLFIVVVEPELPLLYTED